MFAPVFHLVHRMTGRTKVCRKCGRRKPLVEFSKAANQHDGKQSWCRDCHNAYGKAWYEKQRVKIHKARNNISPLTIKCSRCGRKKPPTAFNVRAASPNGRQPWCKKCQARYYEEAIAR